MRRHNTQSAGTAPESRWSAIPGTLQTGSEPTELVYMVTLPSGVVPEFHPIIRCKYQAAILAGVMNELRWTEDDYLEDAGELVDAVTNGDARKYLRNKQRAVKRKRR